MLKLMDLLFFGSCSAISVRIILKTVSKVVRAFELAPSFSWQFVTFQSLANSTYVNASLVDIAVSQRLSKVNTFQFIFPSNSWTTLSGNNLPPGDYKVQFNAMTWYGGIVQRM